MINRFTTSSTLKQSSKSLRQISKTRAAPIRCLSTITSSKSKLQKSSPFSPINLKTSIPIAFNSSDSSRFSTSSAVRNQEFEQSTLSPQEYHKVADQTLDILTECFEVLLESEITGDDWDLEVASGVMNFRLGENGTYVINKQPPNSQIWLSSPLSGPSRFDYSSSHQTWFSTKEGRETITLKGILEKELKDIFGEFEFDGDF